jgi:xanthosine utilization system XapX-like protein
VTAGPPPSIPNLYSGLGLQIGVVYGLASMAMCGPAAIAFPILGYLIGKCLD